MRRLRRALRAIARAMALIAATTALMTCWWLGAAWQASPAAAWEWRCRWFGRWARAAVRILGVRVEVRGPPPAAPFLLVCNHLGYLDVAVLASRVDSVFVAKAEVERWPILGPLCRAMGTLFLDRGRRRDVIRALARIDEQLAAGRGVLVFPEGTSSPGSEVLPFHPSLLAAGRRAELSVRWAALSYATPPGERPATESVCWWGSMELLPHLAALLALPRVDARLCFGSSAIAGADRKELAIALRDAVAGAMEREGLGATA